MNEILQMFQTNTLFAGSNNSRNALNLHVSDVYIQFRHDGRRVHES